MLIKGNAYWAKIVGKPQPGYEKDQLEWSLDVANLSKETLAQLKTAGLSKFIKDKDDDRGKFIHLRRKAMKKDGTPAKPIKIVDHRGEDWDGKLVGNGSELNVNIAINEFDKNLSMSPISIQVWRLTPYVPKSSFPVRETDEGDVIPETVVTTETESEWS